MPTGPWPLPAAWKSRPPPCRRFAKPPKNGIELFMRRGPYHSPGVIRRDAMSNDEVDLKFRKTADAPDRSPGYRLTL